MNFDLPQVTFKDGWIEQNLEILKKKNNISDDKLDEVRDKLGKIYDERIVHHKCNIVNNYKGISVNVSYEDVANLILRQGVVLGGDGVLFKQHYSELSFLVPIITKLQKDRSMEKKARDKFEKGSTEWLYHNRNQNNKKVVINALYGLFGYTRFRFYNINLAQAVTAMGQNIISTATCAFEDFLADNSKFVSEEECISYINRVCHDAETVDYQEVFDNIPTPTDEDLVLRIRNRTYHIPNQEKAEFIIQMIQQLSDKEKKLLYYKNNFIEFLNIPYIHNMLGDIIDSIEFLQLGEMYVFQHQWSDDPKNYLIKCNPGTEEKVKLFLDIIRNFVLSTHQIFDRVRRTKYTEKRSVLYIDTDSNFIGLGKYIDYCKANYADIYNNEKQYEYKVVSLITMILSMVIRETYHEFTNSMAINNEYGPRLNMKNEFLFSLLVFGMVKKRYIGKMIIQEGKLIKDGKGDIEVKGFDFKKAVTKKEIREAIEDIVNETLLDVDQIDIKEVYRAADAFKRDIADNIKNGSNIYYKQLSVSKPDKYALPYQNQGICGTLAWNAVMVDSKITLPAEVDMVPITLAEGLTSEKRFREFIEDPEAFFENNPKFKIKASPMYNFMKDYPVEFNLLLDNLMRMTEKEWKKPPAFVAKPRYLTDIPDWLASIINVDKIISNNVNLINPILQSLGSVIIKSKTGPMYTTLVNF